jgi:hypothetical protein
LTIHYYRVGCEDKGEKWIIAEDSNDYDGYLDVIAPGKTVLYLLENVTEE